MSKQTNKKRRNRIIIAVIVLIVIAGAGALVVRQGQQLQQESAEASAGDIVTAFVGDLSAGATASGKVTSPRDAMLAPLLSGTVEEIYVEVGDTVQKGDPLIQLETTELERAVESARQSLIIQESNLAKLQEPASTADLLSAEAAVASAQATLNSMLDGPSAEDLAAAEANLRAANADIAAAAARLNDAAATATPEEIQAAQIELDLAQTAATQAAEQHSTTLVMEPEGYLSQDIINDLELSARTGALQANARLAAAQDTLNTLQNGDFSSIAAAQAGLTAATAQRDIAQLQLDMLNVGATAAQIAAAEANVAQAKATLDRLQRGATDSQIAMTEVAVEQARIGLQNAENNLAKATLTAPFDGMVTAVYVNEGEQASGLAIEMVDNDNLEVVLYIDEVDMANLAVGQPATITLETWPDEEISGEVTAVAPSAIEDNSALVTYEVYLSLGQTDLPILVGMTANADLITVQKEDVLLLPNAAINADRSNGTYSVNLVTGYDDNGIAITSEQPVTIGLRDRQFTQITSGLNEGDEVMVGNILPTFQFGPPEDGEGQRGGGGPFGG